MRPTYPLSNTLKALGHQQGYVHHHHQQEEVVKHGVLGDAEDDAVQLQDPGTHHPPSFHKEITSL